MTINVLIVDDSGFFRRRLTALINASPDFKVIGSAENGVEAVEMNERLKPDVITMDYEMPVMDGITAVREIMAKNPVPILMFSSMTHEGAKVTLDSLAAGALDFLPKQFEEIAKGTEEIQKVVTAAIRNIASSNYRTKSSNFTRQVEVKKIDTENNTKNKESKPTLKTIDRSARERAALEDVESGKSTSGKGSSNKGSSNKGSSDKDTSDHSALHSNQSAASQALSSKRPINWNQSKVARLVIIGTSTGGPVALQQVLTSLPRSFSKPIIIVQHMPANFTKAFAERLDSLCQIQVKEAEDGDMIKPGLALLAPGGKQVLLSHNGAVKVIDGDDRMTYKPSVDVTFGSAANVYPDGVLGVVLTGMGTDGREGARLLKQSGSSVWAQDQESSVIYGMPMAVTKAGLVDEIHNLESLSLRLKEIG